MYRTILLCTVPYVTTPSLILNVDTAVIFFENKMLRHLHMIDNCFFRNSSEYLFIFLFFSILFLTLQLLWSALYQVQNNIRWLCAPPLFFICFSLSLSLTHSLSPSPSISLSFSLSLSLSLLFSPSLFLSLTLILSLPPPLSLFLSLSLSLSYSLSPSLSPSVSFSYRYQAGFHTGLLTDF